MDGILQAYDNAFRHVLLSGPTCFAEVIQYATNIASQPYTKELQVGLECDCGALFMRCGRRSTTRSC